MSETPSARRTPGALALAVRHYIEQVRIDRVTAVPALVLPGIGSICVFYLPALVIGRILGRFTTDPAVPLSELMPLVLVFGGVWLAGELVWRLGIHFLIKTEIRGQRRLYNNAMDHLLRKDLAFFHDNFAGSLTKRTINYARSYEGFLDTMSFSVFDNLLPLVFTVVVLWRYSPWLIVVLLGMLVVTGLAIAPLIKRRMKLVAKRESASTRLSGHISDSIMNMDAVRAFARERHEATVHAANVEDYIVKAKRSWDYQNRRIDMVTSPLYVLTNMLGLVLAIAVGQRTAIPFEAVFVTYSFYTNSTRVMWEFNRIYRNLESHLTEAAQFTELLLNDPSVNDPATPAVLAPADSGVSFRDVHFGYGEGSALFEGLSLDIAAGEKIGLVGHSGGGKTTITRLLLRFRDIDRGQILIGGQDIASLRQADLRSLISYVPQEPIMFHRSLADNIRFGRLDASDDDVREAARMANAAGFIEQLPNAYDTLVGERGVKLSGGQRQRIAIARAMVKGAPILLLDEATSSLDSDSERLIQDALWRLMEGRTALVIAHRLSTVQKMDRLIVLEEGAIAEQGSHRDLLATNGIYATLWAHQSGGFLLEDAEEPVSAP